MSEAAIGFFDSGIGGLTVLRTIRQKLPFENLIYLGDTARLPYGTKSPETIYRYTNQSIQALVKLKVKAIVVACNSASTALLNKALPVTSPVPIYNVIEPGSEVALRASVSKRIGVLGTRATVQSNAYVNAIHARNSLAVVIQQAAPLLVPLVEEGWESDPLTNLIIYRYTAPIMAQSIDTLILGCTHYPALRAGIIRVVGNSVELVDSADAIAESLERDFSNGLVRRNESKEAGKLQLFATDASVAMDLTAQRLMNDPALPSFQHCDL